MKRTIWRDAPEETKYVRRCSWCGKFKKKLKEHWFFTGLYCVSCVQDVLYDNARTLEEMR